MPAGGKPYPKGMAPAMLAMTAKKPPKKSGKKGKG